MPESILLLVSLSLSSPLLYLLSFFTLGPPLLLSLMVYCHLLAAGAICNFAFSIGSLGGPIVISALCDRFGFFPAYVVMAAAVFLLAIVLGAYAWSSLAGKTRKTNYFAEFADTDT